MLKPSEKVPLTMQLAFRLLERLNLPKGVIGLQAQNSMRMAVLRALDEAGIEIPFPQRDLHIRYAPDGPASPVAAAYAEIAPPPKTA